MDEYGYGRVRTVDLASISKRERPFETRSGATTNRDKREVSPQTEDRINTTANLKDSNALLQTKTKKNSKTRGYKRKTAGVLQMTEDCLRQEYGSHTVMYWEPKVRIPKPRSNNSKPSTTARQSTTTNDSKKDH